MKQAEAIAKEKMKDLNAFDIKEATKIIWFCKVNGISKRI